MAFSDFQSIEQVLAQYPLEIRQESFLSEVEAALPDLLLENLHFLLTMKAVEENEAFFTEGFIFPLLQQAWKQHRTLKLWSHRMIAYDNTLFGAPDYLLSAALHGVTDRLLTTPLVAVIEAKKEDFTRGWGQCVAAMLAACQKINADDQLPVYGIVSSGLFWEFGKLEAHTFTKHLLSYAISDPQKVYGLVESIFAACEEALMSYGQR